MVRDVLYGETSDEAKIVVSNAFHLVNYQVRLEMVQEFGFTWGKINPSVKAAVLVVDEMGNFVGSRSFNGHVWVNR
jgi:hypothetical protein